MKSEIKVLYVVSLATFMRSFGQVIYSPSIVTMRNDLLTTTTMIGLTFSVYGMILAFSQVAYGPIVDRFDTKKLLIFGLGFFSIASLAGYLANGIWLILIVRGFQAIGIAAAASVGIALMLTGCGKTLPEKLGLSRSSWNEMSSEDRNLMIYDYAEIE
ncbi:MAG: MFS transporter, partial [Chloroflexi bacterium]|nr:MFS transporter [Chloroflexota bacterium]